MVVRLLLCCLLVTTTTSQAAEWSNLAGVTGELPTAASDSTSPDQLEPQPRVVEPGRRRR